MKHRGPLLIAGLVLAAMLFVLSREGWKSGSNPVGGDLRIVSLAPNATEILFMLGVGDRLVGVTNVCNHPPAAQSIEQIGLFGDPNVERLLAVRPTLVVCSGLSPAVSLDALRNSNIRIVQAEINSFETLFAAITNIGTAVGRENRAREIIKSMEDRLRKVREDFEKTPPEKLPRVYVEIWNDPLMTVGGTCFMNEMISLAGGVNVAREIAQDFPKINPEKVVEWNPDVILVARMTSAEKAGKEFPARIGWNGISAVRNGRLICDIDLDLLLRAGPRLIDGVEILHKRFRTFSGLTNSEETSSEPHSNAPDGAGKQ
ncbi:MAG TPA: cobalamin-binding protein [Candidatus Brocadiia bacterium]|nr:cobalamin-binding protein [Candidatus Brocadiia bacterium]